MTTNVKNYVPANRFFVQMGSATVASFMQCSGLSATIAKEPYREGGVNDQQRFFLKDISFSDVTLRRGVTNNTIFLGWLTAAYGIAPRRRTTVKIFVYNQAGMMMQTWNLIGAVAVSWKAPDLQADSNQVAIEELTLAYEGLTIEPAGSMSSLIARPSTGYFG